MQGRAALHWCNLPGRVWPDGLRALFEDAGLTEIACDRMAVDTYGTARKPEGVACVSSEFVQRIGGRG
jgi:hypothetical protein